MFDRRTDAYVVQPGGLGRKASLDIAQTFPTDQLRKRRNAEMPGASECADTAVFIIPGHEPVKRFPRKKIHDSSEQHFSGVDPILLLPRVCQKQILSDSRSNPGYPDFAIIYCNY